MITLEQSLRLSATRVHARSRGRGELRRASRRAARGRGRVLALRERARPGAVGGRRHRAADRRRGGAAGADRGARAGDLARGPGGRGRARGARGAAPRGRRDGVLPARRDPRRARLAAAAGRPDRRAARWCARWRARRSSCARSTSRAARRSRAGASSTWSAALAAAIESPQVPPEARERIRGFLKLYRAAMATIDSTRPDLYVHRLIDRLGLRRQQLFAAQADVVERLRALARFGELAGAYARRAPQATPREFARHIAAVADFGLREQEEPDLLRAAGGAGRAARQRRRARGRARVRARAARRAVRARARADPAGPLRAPGGCGRRLVPGRRGAGRRPRRRPRAGRTAGAVRRRDQDARRVVLAYPPTTTASAALAPAPVVDAMRRAVAGAWEDREEELFGPAETLHSTYRLLRDEVLEGTMRAGGRLGELRLDTDLDVSHAVVRYLELLKLAALIERPEGQVARRGAARRQLADPAGGDRRAARDLHVVRAGRLSARRRARRAPPGPGGGGARRAVGGVVPAHARRRGRAVGVRHRHLPDVPAEVQVRAGIPDPPGADDPPALRDRGPPGARALPRALGRGGVGIAAGAARAARRELAARRVRRLRGGAPAAGQGRGRADALPRRAFSPRSRSRCGSSARSRSSSGRTCCAAASTASIASQAASTS